MKLTVSEKGHLLKTWGLQKMAVYMCAHVCEFMQVCVHLWVNMLVIWEEDENIGVSMMRTSRAFLKGTLFSGSLAMLIECDSFIKSHDLVHTYQF